MCVGHVEILEKDKKARLPWSLKNGGNSARHPSRFEIAVVLGKTLGNLPVSKGVFERRTSTKGVACERAHLYEFEKNLVGSGR